jgi:hypothetical protein
MAGMNHRAKTNCADAQAGFSQGSVFHEGHHKTALTVIASAGLRDLRELYVGSHR